ncbi:MAG: DUF167 domain-containing protein [Thermodesulfobacteriota bacterium]|nr:DUF167 domain-containing protein [Thermodesulfobacteriota bacterium]
MQIKDTGTALAFSVFVVPKSSKNAIMGIHNGALKIKITAPPVDGKANAICVKYIAKQLKVPRSAISITAGAASRNKEITVEVGNTAEGREMLRRLKSDLAKY